MNKKKIVGICIKQYIDERDLLDYKDGGIDEKEIRIYNVGDEGEIVRGYNPKYWKPKAIRSNRE